MFEQRKWWSGHSLYGIQPQEYRFRNSMFQEIPYIDLSPDSQEELQLSYWKSMYPEKIKKVQKKVEEACEELEYDNSPMYDEYPDKVFLRRLCNGIYEELSKDKEFQNDEISEELFDTSAFQSAYAAVSAAESYPAVQRTEVQGKAMTASRPGQMRPPIGPDPAMPPRRPGTTGSKPVMTQKDSWLRDITEVLLYQEMHQRRCARKKYGKIHIWT